MESLTHGGKERRAVELFHYLKKNTKIEYMLVLMDKHIHYDYIFKLNIPIITIERRFTKYDPSIFIRFSKIVKEFRPDIIHVWGAMSTFYAIPAAKYFHIPLINGQIADSTVKNNRSVLENILFIINRNFSTLMLSNSYAGLEAYGVNSKKGVVIYNGVRMERFKGLKKRREIKKDFNIDTPLSVIMIGHFSYRKNYRLFLQVAKEVCEMRDDVTFLAIGSGENRSKCEDYIEKWGLNRILFAGPINNIEDLINGCDVGVLLSSITDHSEGIPNVVIEYMALSKPVIASNDGGTKELVSQNISGFLVNNEKDIIVNKINKLLDSSDLRKQMGAKGREIIETNFTIDRMGREFVKQYNKFFK